MFLARKHLQLNTILTLSKKNCAETSVDQTTSLSKEFLKSEISLLCSVYFLSFFFSLV